MQTDNLSAGSLQNNNSTQNQVDLKGLGGKLHDKTGFVARKEEIMTAHMEALVQRNHSWLERMTFTSGEKELLKGFVEKQKDAMSIILDNQNKALSALCGGQVTFIKEVVNTMLKTGRAGLKANADLIFMEHRIQRANRMEMMTNEFYDLVQRKFADAEKRPEVLRDLKMKEIQMDMKKWDEDYELLLNEFSSILTEQV